MKILNSATPNDPFSAGIYLFKVNNENRAMREIYSKLIIKSPEGR